MILERDASFPRDEIVLSEEDGLGGVASGGGFDDELEEVFSGLGDGFGAADDDAGVVVDEVVVLGRGFGI